MSDKKTRKHEKPLRQKPDTSEKGRDHSSRDTNADNCDVPDDTHKRAQ